MYELAFCYPYDSRIFWDGRETSLNDHWLSIETIENIENILDPVNSWKDSKKYYDKLKYLAALFIKNFKKYNLEDRTDILNAGPTL